MPLQPVSKVAPLPTRTDEDVHRLFTHCVSIGRGELELGLSNVGHYGELAARYGGADFLQHARKSATELYLRGIADHWLYIGAVNPESFRPLQRTAADLDDAALSAFCLGLEGWLYLLDGAPDDCVRTIAARLAESSSDWRRLEMLAAISTPASLQALADFARQNDRVSDCERLGFAIPENGPAERRFLKQRFAVRIGSRDGAASAKHVVGLPLSTIVDGVQPDIAWHYLTLTLSEIPEAETLPFRRLHLVSPEFDCDWVIACRVSDEDRYAVAAVNGTDDEAAKTPDAPEAAVAELLPFDDGLTYCNGHVFLTNRIQGVVGGPPIGLYDNPNCLNCGKLMLHLCTAQTYINEFGDGFRCLYVCEICRMATCTGVSWN